MAYPQSEDKGTNVMNHPQVVIAFRNPYDGEPDTLNVEERIAMINWYAENVMEPYRSDRG